MRVTHPRALDDDAGPPPAAVDVRGRTVPLGDDDAFETDDEAWVRRFANRYDVDPEDIVPDWGDADDDAIGSPFDPGEYTVPELEDELVDEDYGGSELHALAAEEQRGKNRETAIEAIESRIPGNAED